MLSIRQTKRFSKDVIRMQKRQHNMKLLRDVIERIRTRTLQPKDKDHALKGEYHQYRECHIKGDWVLVYREIDTNIIELYRTGTHQDIFKKKY